MRRWARRGGLGRLGALGTKIAGTDLARILPPALCAPIAAPWDPTCWMHRRTRCTTCPPCFPPLAQVLEWRERGVNVECVRRTNRQGYKAGAMKEVT